MTARALAFGVLAVGVLAALAQTANVATTNEVYVLSALVGDAKYVNGKVILDAPLTLTLDPQGQRHLGVALDAAICTTDASGNRTCTIPVLAPPAPPRAPISVRNEIPAPVNATVWRLAHVPVAGATCRRNGLAQTPGGIDYTLVGDALSSGSWMPSDMLLCDYDY